MENSRKAVISNLTFLLGQLEVFKSNLNDTLRYVQQNPETWQDEETKASTSELQKDVSATPSSTMRDFPEVE
jgi:regulator of sirC expression with transglutaminase-like and TPR domain